MKRKQWIVIATDRECSTYKVIGYNKLRIKQVQYN